MKLTSGFLLITGLALSGCQSSAPSMSLEEARKLALDFQTKSFTPPERTIADYRKIFPDNFDQFGEECEGIRNDRIEELQYYVDFATSGSKTQRWRGSAGLLYVAEKEFVYGNFKTAIDATQKTYSGISNIIITGKSKWIEHRKAIMKTQLGRMRAAIGQNSEARDDFGSASSHWSKAGGEYYGAKYGQAVMNHAANASLARIEGNLPAEEYYLRQVLKEHKKSLAQKMYSINKDIIATRLSNNLILQGRFVEAELAAKELAVPFYVTYALTYGAFANALYAQGRYDDAAFLVKRAINRHYEECSNADGIPRIEAWRIYFKSLGAQGKWTEIQSSLYILNRDLVDLPERYEELFGTNPDILMARAFEGSDATLLADLDRALAGDKTLVVSGDLFSGLQQTLGLENKAASIDENTREILELRLIKGLALQQSGQAEQALAAFQDSIKPYLYSTYTQNGFSGGDGRAEFFRQGYMALLASDEGQKAAQNVDINVAEELFKVATMIPSGKVQSSFMASASRAATQDPELGNLVRQAQDLDEQARDTANTLAYLQTAPSDQVDTDSMSGLRKQVLDLNNAKLTLDTEINSRFPEYADLMRPRTPSIDEIRAMLSNDEAMVVISTKRDRTYVWAIPKLGEIAFNQSALGEKNLKNSVTELRLALEPQVSSLKDIPDFDVGLAHELYKKLLAPVEAGWKSAKNLIVVAGGPLGHLPLSTLPTEISMLSDNKALLFDKFRNVQWLARTHTVTMLPSVASLQALRSGTIVTAERRPFVGFGDPYFTKLQAVEAESQIAASTQLADANNTRGILNLRSVPDTRSVDSADLGRLPRLPGSRDEIIAVATSMGANMDTEVFLGRAASEHRVKSMDLSNYKVLSFATHGLVAGDLDGLSQPALAFSNPNVTSEDDDNDDGLLTLGEILGLKLNADWVILSACNTAAADGEGAEALSGLGRAFFYAGTRAVLASSWSVHDGATKELMTVLFNKQAANDNLGRAEALQQTRVQLIDQGVYKNKAGKELFSYAHPIFWAPFIIIGDGGV